MGKSKESWEKSKEKLEKPKNAWKRLRILGKAIECLEKLKAWKS